MLSVEDFLQLRFMVLTEKLRLTVSLGQFVAVQQETE